MGVGVQFVLRVLKPFFLLNIMIHSSPACSRKKVCLSNIYQFRVIMLSVICCTCMCILFGGLLNQHEPYITICLFILFLLWLVKDCQYGFMTKYMSEKWFLLFE